MPDKIIVYEKPTWTKCREADRLLRESGIEFEKVNFHAERFDEATLREVIRKTGLAPRELLRTGEATYKRLDLGGRELSDDEVIRLMAAHPELIQRPIVVRGDRAVLARPAEKIREVMDS
jgi:arsenate reductase (glutaredoxin)